MRTNECDYCGAILDYSVHKCTNCGGQVKRLATIDLKQIKKIVIYVLFVGLVIAPFIYKTHLNNIATTVLTKLQTSSSETPAFTQPTEATKNLFEKKIKLSQVIAATMPIKVVVIEFYMTQGRFPVSLDELGFNEKSFDTGELIQDIQLSKTGEIRIDLDTAVFGKRKHFTLVPKEIMGGMNIEWSCFSNLARNVVPFQCKSA